MSGVQSVSSNLGELIDQAIVLKEGNKEFALHFVPGLEEPWAALIGATSDSVLLGECRGDFETAGRTPEQALQRLIEEIQNGQ